MKNILQAYNIITVHLVVVESLLFYLSFSSDPCQVEFCVVKTYASDVANEDSCFQLLTSSSSSDVTKPARAPAGSAYSTTGSSSHSRHHHTYKHHQFSHPTIGQGQRSPAFPAFANPIHSHREDGLGEGRCVLAISDVVKINIHPQEKANNSFNVFS